MITSPFFAIDRLRIDTDGPGITTLVGFMGCPLSCKYCVNNRCHEPLNSSSSKIMILSPQELYDKVKIDNLYFYATGGGITFGGGEPMLYPEFIKEFRSICGDNWKINIETSAYCSIDAIRDLSKIVDRWYIDVKSLDATIYEEYTGKPMRILNILKEIPSFIPLEKITIRLPSIPKYTEYVDFDENIQLLNRLGFNDIDRFEYDLE